MKKSKIIILLLFIFVQNVFSQKDFTNSFRIKTEIVQFVSFNPNIFFEHKFNTKFAYNIGVTYHANGIIWSAPYLLFSSNKNYYKTRNVEWWVVNGYGFDIGVKYYLSENKYFSFRTSVDTYYLKGTISANSERNEDQITEKLNRYDLHLQVIYGKENMPKNILFSEIYFGIGLLFVNEKRYIIENVYDNNNNHYLGKEYVDHSTNFFVPTLLFGYNIGWSSTR
jgi:hypothetical protein